MLAASQSAVAPAHSKTQATIVHTQLRPRLECGDAAPLSDRPAFLNNPEDSTLARGHELKRMLF